MGNSNKFDFVIVNLKVIAQVPRNRRLKTTSNGFFTLEDNHLLVPLRRKIYGEGRNKLLRDIKSLLVEIQNQVRTLLPRLQSDSENDDVDSDNAKGKLYPPTNEKCSVREQLICIHRELQRSIHGFENLKSTYSSDILMVGELEHIVDTIRIYLNEIEQKVPDVEENIPAVLIDKVAH